MRRTAALCLLIASFSTGASAQPVPTRTGDIIGVAKLLADGSLQMDLRSVTCTGIIAEGRLITRPSDPNYRSHLDHIGDLKPGEEKPVPAWPVQPCDQEKNSAR